MTRKSLRNLLMRAARVLDGAAKVHEIPGRRVEEGVRTAHAQLLRTVAKELRDAAAKGIAK